MESWRARASRSKANSICKKHPKHMQSPGVCSICLNEKLSQLMSNSDSSSSSSRAARSRSSSSSSLSSYVSSLSSSNASSCSSPVVDSNSVRVFKKSKSIGIVKGGFWSKLLPRKSRGILMHSRTTRERVVAAFH
ncbi:hypothetical protein C2S51_031986 [Perilla frutescens var. frutescens]|nr:hypothetical protein C2S51_031986 [Perilla frutescens var. frutescens]